METKIFTGEELQIAAEILISDGVIAVPTETVYGLAANGLSSNAIEKIYEAKRRPETRPISLFVRGIEDAEKFCTGIPLGAYKLSEHFWSGPLTMVFKKRSNVPDILTAGGDTVGIRCPDNALTVELLRLTGLPLTGTSANLSGAPNSNNVSDVLRYFDGRIEGVVDGGHCGGGVPSTVLDMTGSKPRIVRLGGISKEDIENILEAKVL